MIRIVILVLLATTSWCKCLEKTNPSDSSKSEYSLLVPPQLNWHLSRPASSTPFQLAASHPLREKINQHSSTTYAERSPAVKERYWVFGLTTGAWVPLGHNNVLGPHPSLGVVAGGWRGQWLIEVEADIRLANAHSYQVLYADTLQNAHQYLGGYAGLHLGYGFLNFKSTSVYLLGAVGIEGFNSSAGPDMESFKRYLSFNSYNLGAGLGFQHFPKKGGYWGAELLYNKLNYQNSGGTPIDGNGMTFKLTFGWIQ